MVKPPEILNYSMAKKESFRPEREGALFLVAKEFSGEPWLAHANARYFGLNEPVPDRKTVLALLHAAVPVVAQGEVVKIACMAGQNRSATVACVTYMAATGCTFYEALRAVRMQRPSAAPFWTMAASVCEVAVDYGFLLPEQCRDLEEACGSPDDFENAKWSEEVRPEVERLKRVVEKWKDIHQPPSLK